MAGILENVYANMQPKWLQERTIFAAYAGSVAYGTATPASDIDIRGVAVAPRAYYHGFVHSFEQAEWTGTLSVGPQRQIKEVDVVIYDLRKWARLAAAGNPNVLEVLFTPPELWLTRVAPVPGVLGSWSKIYWHRHAFLSRRAASRYAGYAVSQLHKLRTGKANSGRGQGRQDLIDAHGYDTKNAMHLVRLLRSVTELLRTGDISVTRSDAEELMTIRNGAWTLEQVEAYASSQLASIDNAKAASPLPESPDMEFLDNLVQGVTSDLL